MLVRRIRAAAGSRDLSLSERAVLGRLDRDGPATTADLARAEGVKPQSMGATIGSLAARGLVVGRPHPTDGRRVNLALTARGAAVRKSASDAKHAWLAQSIAALDKREQATLFAAAAIMKRLAGA